MFSIRRKYFAFRDCSKNICALVGRKKSYFMVMTKKGVKGSC